MVKVGICIIHIFQDQFLEYMFSQAIKLELKVLTENKSKFLAVSCSYFVLDFMSSYSFKE